MKTFVPALVLCLCAALSTNAPRAAVQAAAAVNECGPVGAPSMRTTLYFGLNRKTGNVSETQWKRFLRDHVTPRFPQGLTVWEANGQWRRADGVIVQTPAVHAAIDAIIEDYKKTFEQESVLWETARVCATF
jgi:hypothetical protein